MNIMNLNTEQRKAVELFCGPLVIQAGAGTGKTGVIVQRVLRLVKEGVAPGSILLLSFTNKASAEMKDRVMSVTPLAKEVICSTFHSFARQMLMLLPNENIINNITFEKELNLCIKIADTLKDSCCFDAEELSQLLNKISYSKNATIPLADALDDVDSTKQELFISIADQLKSYKTEHGLSNYDDVLTRFLTELKTDAAFRNKVKQRFKYIMVDEFQDTNLLQLKILKQLVDVDGNIMIVGDLNQSIYGFRGTNLNSIDDFKKWQPNSKVVALNKNYRSSSNILSFANALMDKDTNYIALNTIKGKGENVGFLLYPNVDTEYKYLSREISDLIHKGVIPGEIAVLMRNTKQVSRLAKWLDKYNINSSLTEQKTLLNSAHIKNIIPYFKIKNNMKDKDSWIIILKQHKGIGEKYAVRITEEISKNGLSAISELNGNKKDSLKGLLNLLKKIEALNFKDSIEIIEAYVYAMVSKKADSSAAADIKRDYDSICGDLLCFNSWEEYSTSNEYQKLKNSYDKKQVQVMTIHAAKGLEFDNVFIPDCENNYFPDPRNKVKDEELRLLYVAATRAKERLYVFTENGSYMPKSLKQFYSNKNIDYADKIIIPLEYGGNI